MRSLRKYTVAGLIAVMVALPAVASPAAKRAPRLFVVAIAVPSAGDVSYGIAEVRIGPARRHAGSGAGSLVFAQRIGGLAIAARAGGWQALRATTKVYVAVSTVVGAAAGVREVAFFIVRRRGSGPRSAAADVVFTIANARPVVGSFWVRGVDRRGYADVFQVRDILTTALGNWSRYLGVLRAAGALAAAFHPLVSASIPRAAGPAPKGIGRRRVWTGGQRASARVRAIFRLITSTIGGATAYAAAKRSPLVPDFIAHELGNPSLARRWKQITAKLPLQIPDRFAAAAQEEARFTRVTAPRISPARVAFDVSKNSTEQIAALFVNLVIVKGGPGDGVVESYPYGSGIDCGTSCAAWFPHNVTLIAIPNADSVVGDWQDCPHENVYVPNAPARSVTCELDPSQRIDPALGYAASGPDFDIRPNLRFKLTALKTGSGTGTVTSNPAGIDCGSTCDAPFTPIGPGPLVITLTAQADPGSIFQGWGDCDIATGATCKVALGSDRTVTATFASTTARNVITRVAGDGTRCSARPNCGDGGPARLAQITDPQGVALAGPASFYVVDTNDEEVRLVGPDGTISRIAGSGATCVAAPNCDDGGAATSAELNSPGGVAFDPATGDVYVADTGDNEIRLITPFGGILRFAGDGASCTSRPQCGDGSAATAAHLTEPEGVAVDSAGDVYIADTIDGEIRKVAPNGTITRIAGDGTFCATAPSCGDGGPGAGAQLSSPRAVAVDSAGNLYIADTNDNEIRKVTPGGIITRFAGTGDPCTQGNCGDGGPATSARLDGPASVAIDAAGDLYIADTFDNEIRVVTPDGVINRVAGTGAACTSAPSCGDNGPATAAQLSSPYGVALDPAGNPYIADTFDFEIRRLG